MEILKLDKKLLKLFGWFPSRPKIKIKKFTK